MSIDIHRYCIHRYSGIKAIKMETAMFPQVCPHAMIMAASNFFEDALAIVRDWASKQIPELIAADTFCSVNSSEDPPS